MKTRPVDPRRLDVESFAKEGGRLEGHWPLPALQRLVDAAHADARPAPDDQVAWQAHGESRAVRGGEPQVWLHLRAHARMSLVCQRCLGPLETDIVAERSILFVRGEEAATELDADLEDDVLALPRSLDLRELVEDELLLALPLVPRHDTCPRPLPSMADDDEPAERANPFAVLVALKREDPPH